MVTRLILLLLSTIEAFRPHQTSKRPLKAINRLIMTIEEVDVAVIGAGVGGCTIAWMLAEKEECKVALIDSEVETGTWYPNYGEWRTSFCNALVAAHSCVCMLTFV